MLKTINTHIKKLNFGYQSDLLKNKIKYYNSYASFLDPNTLLLENAKGEKEEITAKNIVIATGTRPKYLDLPGSEFCITSDDFFWRK